VVEEMVRWLKGDERCATGKGPRGRPRGLIGRPRQRLV
jgi:hypothetical protein